MDGYDNMDGPQADSFNPKVIKRIRNDIIMGIYVVLTFGYPCQSWSIARKDDGVGPGALRDSWRYLFGLPGSSEHDQYIVDKANKLLYIVVDLIELALQYAVIVIFENPVYK